MDDLVEVSDDGLAIDDVRAWAEQKYRLIRGYSSVFLKAIRNKWGGLVYIDLYAGPGYVRIEGTTRIVRSSPLAVLGLSEAFDQYIFADINEANTLALRTRCLRDHGERNVHVLCADANVAAGEIVKLMLKPQAGYRVLGLCFLDPYNANNLSFSTIRTLATRFMDFIVLIPSGMDINRNEIYYLREDNTVIERFTGDAAWRDRWKVERERGKHFGQFVTEHFGRAMSSLGFIDEGSQTMALIRSDKQNLPLYHLALYSKNELGNKFWKEVQKYSTPQRGFDGF